MPYGLLIKFGPYFVIGALLVLYLGKRDELASAVEQCNNDKLLAIADAEKVARRTVEEGFAERLRQLERNAATANEARAIAEQARIEAESRPERIREVIKRVEVENECLSTAIDPAVLDSLRN